MTCKITDSQDERNLKMSLCTRLLAIHTSLGCLKSLAGARGPFSLVIQDPDGDVVDAVRLEAWQTALATIPAERQNVLLLLSSPCCLVQATLSTVVHLEGQTRGVDSYIGAPHFRLSSWFPVKRNKSVISCRWLK